MLNRAFLKQLSTTPLPSSFYLRSATFASLNTQAIDSAIQDHSHTNWSKFFTLVRAEDVSSSDYKTVGKLLKALTYAA